MPEAVPNESGEAVLPIAQLSVLDISVRRRLEVERLPLNYSSTIRDQFSLLISVAVPARSYPFDVGCREQRGTA